MSGGIKTIVWLFSVWRLYRHYHSHSLLFSQRLILTRAVRPPIAAGVIDFPDAFFFIKPKDVARAIAMAHAAPGLRRECLKSTGAA